MRSLERPRVAPVEVAKGGMIHNIGSVPRAMATPLNIGGRDPPLTAHATTTDE